MRKIAELGERDREGQEAGAVGRSRRQEQEAGAGGRSRRQEQDQEEQVSGFAAFRAESLRLSGVT